MIRLAIAGATGRTGRCLLETAARDERFEVTAALTQAGDPLSGSTLRCGLKDVPIVERLEVPCDVLIDFTVADGTMAWLEVCCERRLPMVIGATGHSEGQLARIREASGRIPILKAANFSMGINAILALVSRLSKELGEEYDVEIVEAHHRHKVDAPSGTALAMAEEILAGRGEPRDGAVILGRSGQVGSRPPGQIGIHALRMGDFVGRHEIHFGGPGETITIQHSAYSRETFAAGALRAASWIIGKSPGFYSMRDVLAVC